MKTKLLLVCVVMMVGCERGRTASGSASPAATNTDAPNRDSAPRVEPAPRVDPAPVVATPLTDAQKIDRLLAAMADSDAVFIRNGAEHTGAAAADHLRSKLKNSGGKPTVRDFIDRVASVSSLTGKPYQVRTADGTMTDCRDWLNARLTRIETDTGG